MKNYKRANVGPPAIVLWHSLDYSEIDGQLMWANLPRACHIAKRGDRAGWIDKDGYRRVMLAGKTYLAHRVIWAWMTGAWPDFEIDHRNENKDDNRWSNLRQSSRSKNVTNIVAARIDNSLGIRGVTKHYSGFRARIIVDGKPKNLGTFQTAEAAAKAYEKHRSEAAA